MAVESKLRFVRTRPLTVLTILFSLVFLTFYHGGQHQLPNVSQIGTKLSNRLTSQTASRLARYETLYQRHVAARKEYLISRSGYRENFDPWRPMSEHVGWWWYFQPAFNCPWEVERIGKFSRGGLWTCGSSLYETQQLKQQQDSKPCVVYSMTKDTSTFSFELELIKRAGCEVWIYAPSLPSKVTNQPELRDNPKVHFVETAIGKTDRISRDGTPFMTLPTIMKDNGHLWVDFLKLDVEGAEYRLLDRWMEHYDDVLPFSQLLVKIHLKEEDGDEVSFSDFRQWWERVEAAGLRPFWAEQDTPESVIASLKSTGEPVKFSHYSFINTRGRHILVE
ncbi:hypothetical protein BGX30_007409 [Mortierella sp. GBA39]|nr:hypothetical protein BGX30_007409 [Mortierella sp. GBA39]